MHRGTLWKTVKRFQAQGSLEDRPRAGRPRTATARRVVEAVRARIRRNPRLSEAKAAPELGISRRSFGRIVKDRLGMRPYKHVARQQLTALQKAKRLERCKTLLRFLKSGRHLVTVWSDEKLFGVDAVWNRQNDRVIAPNIQAANERGRIVHKSNFCKSVMVWGGITANGKTPLIFIDEGVKINAEIYKKKVLEDVLVPWAGRHFGNRRWVLQQDGAPAHTANSVQTWCQRNLSAFIPKQMWPPSSPDLNPMDFSVWAVMEAKACSKSHSNIKSLKAALQKAWDEIDVDYLRKTVEAVPCRLRECIKAKGDTFE